MDKAIGVFDSGIGGLTVLKEIIALLPSEDTIYLGDTARVPYGTKSKETVIRYSIENANFLIGHGLKLLVVACNTASAYSLSELRILYPIPIVGVIEPGARKASIVTKNRRIGVIGTEGTIRSGAYVKALNLLNKDLQVFSQPCPLFVPLVEEGWVENEVALLTARRYLDRLKREGIDTLILGCTHYPLLKGVIREVMGDGVYLVDSATETAKEVEGILKERGDLKREGRGSHRYFVTDSPERFISVGKRFIGDSLEGVRKVDIP